jgi:hypothetical protein
LGHWPPLLYLVQAAASLIFSPSRYVILGVDALFAGILASILFFELRSLVGSVGAAIGALVFLFTPRIRVNASMAMAEMLLTLTMFLACLSFARFAATRQRRNALWFGFWMAAAVLTKGTGWGLVLVPPVVVLATRDWRLVLDRSLWLAALLVLVICVPYQIATMPLAAYSWEESPSWLYTKIATIVETKFALTATGIPVFAAAVIGAILVFLRRSQVAVPAYGGVLAGLIAAAWLPPVAMPTGLEPRQTIPAMPAIFLFAAVAASAAGRLLPRWHRQVSGTLFGLLMVASVANGLRLFSKPAWGFLPVVTALEARMPPESAALLVSDANGEGAVISEFALRQPDPHVYLIRGSKLLASQGWNVENYRNLVHSGDECERLLESIPISYIMVDRRRVEQRQELQDFVEDMLRTHSAEWRLVKEFPSLRDSATAIALYEWSGGPSRVSCLPAQIEPEVLAGEPSGVRTCPPVSPDNPS